MFIDPSIILFWWWSLTPQNLRRWGYSLISFMKVLFLNTPLSAIYASTMIPWFRQYFSCNCFTLFFSIDDNPSWCSTCIYPLMWYTKIQPPTKCSEVLRPNELKVCHLIIDSKWSNDTDAPGCKWFFLRSPSGVRSILVFFSWITFCLALVYWYIAHSGYSSKAFLLDERNFSDLNGVFFSMN